ncbi:M20/M25/M40 family metallo-hydrolase [Sphingomicrobium nitratireducens]|uniref:M20/M25/M40 family metallo-hydrolase n=1 Tax=Sphingomicrobium nitratireducens TaxID=2964666 RepID=UPI00223FF6E3|nr:M20/M25/M40 family metallo-hydrolase [Sphingomicrobium nitratireducens]
MTAALLAAAAIPSLAAAQQTMPPPVIVDREVAALRDAALEDDYAWDIVEALTTEVGPRLAATEAEARARAWSVAKLKAMGFANVRVEEFTMPRWTRGSESAHVLSPFPQPLAVTALGNSGSTGAAGVTGDIVAFSSIDELRVAPDEAVKGKIVFVDHAMAPTQDGSSYGPGGAPRRQAPTLASQKGALAVIVRSAGTDHHRHPHTGTMAFADGAKPIPAGALSVVDAEQLVRILERGRPVRLHLVLENERVEGQTSGNVIAEVPGRDPSLAPILVAGHLDSWDLGTGAIDDGAGVAIAAAAAKRIMDAGRPLRTIRIVWFGAEEPGLFGGRDYLARHGSEDHYAALESDFGADRIFRIDSKLGEARVEEARMLAAAVAPLGVVTGAFDRAEGSDISPLLNAGTPGVGLSQDGMRYFDYHHTADDTLDKIDPEALRQNVAAWTAVLAILSGGVE